MGALLFACSLPVPCGVPAGLRGSGRQVCQLRARELLQPPSRVQRCPARLGSAAGRRREALGTLRTSPSPPPGAISPCRAGSGGSWGNSGPPSQRCQPPRSCLFPRLWGAGRSETAGLEQPSPARRAPRRRGSALPLHPQGRGKGKDPRWEFLPCTGWGEGKSGGGLGS